MPRQLPQAALDEIAELISGYASHIYVVTLDGNRADTGAAFALSSNAVQTFDEEGEPTANDYLVKIKSVDALRLGFGSPTDRMTIGLENVSGEYRPHWFRGSAIRVGVWIEQINRADPALQPFRSVYVPFFRAECVGAEDTDNLLNLYLVSEAQSRPCGAVRTQSRRCPWRFKDENCAYSGPGSTCSKIYDDATAGCEFYDNQHRFGGIPNPDLNQNLINAQAGGSYGGGGYQGGGGSGIGGGGFIDGRYRDPFEYLMLN